MDSCLAADDSKHDVERDGDPDNRDGVHQTHDDKELGPKHRQQFRLAGDALQKACPEHAYAYANANASETKQYRTGNVEQSCFQEILLLEVCQVKSDLDPKNSQ